MESGRDTAIIKRDNYETQNATIIKRNQDRTQQLLNERGAFMATIYCFTSTGNSLYTANKIADGIGAKVLPMREGPALCEDDVIGFVFPCFFWGAPRRVERFVEGLRITNKDAYVFAVYNCGGPVFGVLGALKKILKSKDIRLRFCARIISVTNYLPEYDAKDSEVLRRRVEARVRRITEAIRSRKTNWIPAITLMNRLISKAYPDESCDRYFTVAPSCNGCGICRDVCPAGNIVMEEEKPGFQHKCEHCLACLHNCSACAIDWKNKTQGKARYRNAEVSLGELIAFNKRTAITTND